MEMFKLGHGQNLEPKLRRKLRNGATVKAYRATVRAITYGLSIPQQGATVYLFIFSRSQLVSS